MKREREKNVMIRRVRSKEKKREGKLKNKIRNEGERHWDE